MATGKVYVGSFGKTDILVNSELDLTGELVALKVLKPGGTVVTWTGTVYETTKVRHTVEEGELDVEGDYKVFPLVTAADGSYVEKGASGTFHVYNEFE